MMIEVTRECNMRCTYCRVDKGGGHMSWRTFKKTADLARWLGHRSFAFTGGEPLMNPDLLEMIDVLAHKFRNPSFSLTTNGMLLSSGFLERIQDYRFLVALSHDGTSQTLNRPMARGDSIRVADAAARLLLEYRPESIVMYTLTPDTVRNLMKDVEHLSALGFKRIRINPDYYRTDWDPQSLSVSICDVLDRFKDIEFLGLEKGYRPGGCGDELFVSVDGMLYPCAIHKDEGLCIGNVETGVNECALERIMSASSSIPVRCIGCEIGNECGMSCACNRLITTHSLCDVSGSFCSVEKALADVRRRCSV